MFILQLCMFIVFYIYVRVDFVDLTFKRQGLHGRVLKRAFGYDRV